ncbi:RluA family pseudouridine synthase [Desulfitobacterium metallireducens]|uniref:Pseudouridine synthase n=1 Tax=Desulfitobacterium metallireducens DSM 15288 TaxID=871968 RepID=W0E661_9FIRM|nr:RluA family pseudouridine synthase [Desulfitobacterium metallireducens]AHF06222.1 RNA pseudouridylate synthase [Desulfitobacterium metallireducens DSM 15288]
MHNSQQPLKHRKTKVNQTSFKVTEPTELMPFLSQQLPDQGRNNIKSLLAHHQILVDDEMVSQYNHPLVIGQQVSVIWGKVRKENQPRGLEILFEDDYLIVVVKEAGLLSIATAKEREQTAYSILSDHVKKKDAKNRIFIVHRLDRDTSGIMLFAKSEKVKKLLQESWKDAVEERRYIAITEGPVTKPEETITSWLKESKAYIMYSSPTPNGGQKAVTHYKVLKKNKNYSMLEVELETGRKNQIRVHMQDLGHPIIGDKKYGSLKNPIRRLGLHARVLAFRHPITGEDVRFETEIPKEFLSLFN